LPQHPELASASWSSSGVVQAVDNFTEFDVVEAAAVGDDCAAQLRNVTGQFEAAWDAGGDTKQALLDLFHTPGDFTKVLCLESRVPCSRRSFFFTASDFLSLRS
jgi:hypothetical protein